MSVWSATYHTDITLSLGSWYQIIPSNHQAESAGSLNAKLAQFLYKSLKCLGF